MNASRYQVWLRSHARHQLIFFNFEQLCCQIKETLKMSLVNDQLQQLRQLRQLHPEDWFALLGMCSEATSIHHSMFRFRSWLQCQARDWRANTTVRIVVNLFKEFFFFYSFVKIVDIIFYRWVVRMLCCNRQLNVIYENVLSWMGCWAATEFLWSSLLNETQKTHGGEYNS